MDYLLSLLFILIPAALLFFEDKITPIKWLGPAFWAYVLGILLRQILPFNDDLSKTLMGIFVVLAIPLLLFSANIPSWLRLAPKTALSYVLYLFSVLLSMGVAIYLVGPDLTAVPERAAMATGVYTGGTSNMAAIHVAIGAVPEVFAQLNFIDLLLSGSYLLVLLSFFPSLLAKWLLPFQSKSTVSEENDSIQFQLKNRKLGSILKYIGGSLLIGFLVLGLSAGLTYLINQKLDETLLIMFITLGGLGASFIPQVQKWPGTYETGDFLFLAFCVAAGAQIDLMALLELEDMIRVIQFMSAVFISILLLFFILAKIFKIDRDTAIITSCAGLFGPPFIGPIAQKLQNREIIISGMTMGVIGLAIGNFAGLMIYAWLT